MKSISEDGGQRSVNFDVSELRKGSVAQNATVTTGWGDGDCGFNFEEDKEYIVYTYGQEQLSTNICMGTSLLFTDAQDGNSETNITSVPEVPIIEPRDDEEDSIVPFVIVALISFSAGALAAYFIGRKKTT